MEICFKCGSCDNEWEEEPDEFVNEEMLHLGIYPNCPNCGSSFVNKDE